VTLREDAYSYWFACYKYEFLIRYKSLDISDTESGWSRVDTSGKSYGESFKEAIDKEIAMRFIAAVLFDKAGASLSEGSYTNIENALSSIEEYAYGEDVYSVLKEDYGIGKAAVKRVALYEAKYEALKAYRFGSDYSGIYASAYAEALDTFYHENYYRYRVIYITDENADNLAAMRADIADGITEEAFADAEKEYSENGTAENYPNGIYLYGGADYSRVFSAELLSAMGSLKEAGAVTEARAADGEASYFVMRCALDDAPYRSEDDKVQRSLEGFAEYAAHYLYRAELEECLSALEAVYEVTDKYSMVSVKKAEKYNVVRELG
jgi:hypothetical protein